MVKVIPPECALERMVEHEEEIVKVVRGHGMRRTVVWPSRQLPTSHTHHHTTHTTTPHPPTAPGGRELMMSAMGVRYSRSSGAGGVGSGHAGCSSESSRMTLKLRSRSLESASSAPTDKLWKWQCPTWRSGLCNLAKESLNNAFRSG